MKMVATTRKVALLALIHFCVGLLY